MGRLEPAQVKDVFDVLQPLDDSAIIQIVLAINQDPNRFRGVGITHEMMVLNLVDKANRRNWILPLMEQARADYNLSELDPLIDELKAQSTDQRLDPYTSRVLSKNIPFLARDELRSQLRFLNLGNQRVICVDGDPDTGKTHTCSFVHHLEDTKNADAIDPFSSIEIDLSARVRNNNSDPFDALELAEIVIRQIPGTRLPPEKRQSFITQSEQPAAWVKDLLGWLSDELQGVETIFWVLIDGFREGLLDEGAHQMIDGLIAAVINEDDTSRPQLSTMRLLLMDYDQSGLGQYDSGWHPDESRDLTTMGSSLYDEIHRYFIEATPDTFSGLDQLGIIDRLANARTAVEATRHQSGKPAMQALADALVNQVAQMKANL